jgi:hypothetical protein
VQAAVRRAAGFHQWSGQPPTIARIIERFSYQVAGRRAAPPDSTVRLWVAGIASAFMLIGLGLRRSWAGSFDEPMVTRRTRRHDARPSWARADKRRVRSYVIRRDRP